MLQMFLFIIWEAKFFQKNGRGGITKVHMVFRRGCPKVHNGPQGGRGGQKYPKIGPHGLRMAPLSFLAYTSDVLCIMFDSGNFALTF